MVCIWLIVIIIIDTEKSFLGLFNFKNTMADYLM